jgi:hypothetical protein
MKAKKKKMKFKELPQFWRRTIIALLFLVILLTMVLVCYFWMTLGSLIGVLF